MGSEMCIRDSYGFVEFDKTDKVYKLKLYDHKGSEVSLTDSGKIGSSINVTKIYELINTYHSNQVSDHKYVIAAMIWIDYFAEDTNLDLGEKALLLIIFGDEADKPTSYAVMKVEIKPPTGAALTVERTMPPGISKGVTDLG